MRKNEYWPRLEDVVLAWNAALPEARAQAFAALKGVPQRSDGEDGVVRWSVVAKRLGVTTRSVRYAVTAAGICPVCLPGRSRSIGLLTSDFRRLCSGAVRSTAASVGEQSVLRAGGRS
jgi:hypothetical protein